ASRQGDGVRAGVSDRRLQGPARSGDERGGSRAGSESALRRDHPCNAPSADPALDLAHDPDPADTEGARLDSRPSAAGAEEGELSRKAWGWRRCRITVV